MKKNLIEISYDERIELLVSVCSQIDYLQDIFNRRKQYNKPLLDLERRLKILRSLKNRLEIIR